jgi:tetratricopeptide (TPR) repeat protein
MRAPWIVLIACAVLLLNCAHADPVGGPNAWGIAPIETHPRKPPNREENRREDPNGIGCENRAQRPDDRIAACRALIDANKRTHNTWSALGEAYADKGDFSAAIDAFTHTINDDQIWLGRIGRALAYARSGNYDAAIADADEFIKINRGGNAQSLALRCRVRAIADREREAALADCNAALDEEPHLANPLNDRVLLLYRLGQMNEALAASEDALKFGGHLPLTLYLRGTIRKQNGDAAGDADIAAARNADPAVAEQILHYVPTRNKPEATDAEPPP